MPYLQTFYIFLQYFEFRSIIYIIICVYLNFLWLYVCILLVETWCYTLTTVSAGYPVPN